MSGLAYSLKREYLPGWREDIHVTTKFQHFLQALGAVDASLISIQGGKDPILNNGYFSGKHGRHGGKYK